MIVGRKTTIKEESRIVAIRRLGTASNLVLVMDPSHSTRDVDI
jgi:hypothetical protein